MKKSNFFIESLKSSRKLQLFAIVWPAGTLLWGLCAGFDWVEVSFNDWVMFSTWMAGIYIGGNVGEHAFKKKDSETLQG